MRTTTSESLLGVSQSLAATLGDIVGLALAILVVLLLTPATKATDRYYGDIEAVSPDGHYKLEAKSPDNAAKGRHPFQSNFTYTLTDTATSRSVWTYKQNEGSPVGAWVSDTGWAVVRTSGNGLLILDPATGKPTATVSILDQFNAQDRLHVHETTAGPMWSKSSLWYFATVSEKACFVVRAWWGTRVIVELASGKLVPDKEVAHEQVLKAERTRIDSVLREAASNPEPARGGSVMHEVITCAHLAGLEGVRESVPFLFTLETWSYSGRSSSWWIWKDGDIAQGGVDPFSYSEFTVRSAAQTAIRRLGAQPAGLPATAFKHYHREYRSQKPVKVCLFGERIENVADAKVGMTPLEVLRKLDAPDAVFHFGTTQAWEYDIDAEKPYTLRVAWSTVGSPKVVSIDRLDPPKWKSGTDRDDN